MQTYYTRDWRTKMNPFLTLSNDANILNEKTKCEKCRNQSLEQSGVYCVRMSTALIYSNIVYSVAEILSNGKWYEKSLCRTPKTFLVYNLLYFLADAKHRLLLFQWKQKKNRRREAATLLIYQNCIFFKCLYQKHQFCNYNYQIRLLMKIRWRIAI